jgi:hypothetical protein
VELRGRALGTLSSIPSTTKNKEEEREGGREEGGGEGEGKGLLSGVAVSSLTQDFPNA